MPAAVAVVAKVLQYSQAPAWLIIKNKKLPPDNFRGQFLFNQLFYCSLAAAGGAGGGGGGGGSLPYLFSKYAGLACQTSMRIFCTVPFFFKYIMVSPLLLTTATL